MAASLTRDQALEELYRAAPTDFLATRDDLARRLKDAGDKDGAAELKAQRKPTQVAFVLNQLARKHEDDVAELVDVGRELARAQRKALRGEPGSDLRDAITRQRNVVRALTTKTAALMKELGIEPGGHLDEIAGALQAALVDPSVGEALEQGRLAKAPAAAAGFPGASPQIEEPEPARGRPATKPAKRERADDDEAEAKKRKADEAREEARRAKEEREEARRARDAEAKRAKAEAERAQAEAKNAREAARLAKEEKAAAKARAEAEALVREAEDAEAAANESAGKAEALRSTAAELAAEARRLAAEAKRVANEAKRTAQAATKAMRRADDDAAAAKSARSAATKAEKRAR